MTDLHQKKAAKNSNTVGAIVAGIAGVVAVGAAVVAAVVMSDKKNQKKVKDAWVGAKEKVGEYMDTIKSQPIVEKSVQKLGEVVNDTKKKIEGKG
jgi:hypothetical protein